MADIGGRLNYVFIIQKSYLTEGTNLNCKKKKSYFRNSCGFLITMLTFIFGDERGEICCKLYLVKF